MPHEVKKVEGAMPSEGARKGLPTGSLPSIVEPVAAGGGLRIAAGLALGVVFLTGLVLSVLHFGDVKVFTATILAADPIWLATAALCQMGTYLCVATIWSRVLTRAGADMRISSLLRLAVLEVFANQAVPTAGLSGSIMVVRGLMHRGIASSIAVTALLVAALSYYVAYLLVALLAFVLLWHMGDFSKAWISLSLAFALVIVGLVIAVLAITRSRGRFIPKRALAWKPVVRLVAMFADVRMDILRDGRLVFEAVCLQCAVFVFDTGTLWCATKAVGMSVGPVRVFISFILGSIVSTLSPIPMGLGTFEATTTGMLHYLGGTIEASLAATLILRGFTLWLPMLPGLWLIHREMRRISNATA